MPWRVCQTPYMYSNDPNPTATLTVRLWAELGLEAQCVHKGR